MLEESMQVFQPYTAFWKYYATKKRPNIYVSVLSSSKRKNRDDSVFDKLRKSPKYTGIFLIERSCL